MIRRGELRPQTHVPNIPPVIPKKLLQEEDSNPTASETAREFSDLRVDTNFMSMSPRRENLNTKYQSRAMKEIKVTVIKTTHDNIRLSRASSQMSKIRSERGNFTPDKTVINVYRLLDKFKHQ